MGAAFIQPPSPRHAPWLADAAESNDCSAERQQSRIRRKEAICSSRRLPQAFTPEAVHLCPFCAAPWLFSTCHERTKSHANGAVKISLSCVNRGQPSNNANTPHCNQGPLQSLPQRGEACPAWRLVQLGPELPTLGTCPRAVHQQAAGAGPHRGAVRP